MSKKGSSPNAALSSVLWIAVLAAVVYLVVKHVAVVGNVAVVLLGFGAVVLVHEFGHFIVAKLSGIKVEAFSLFMPPTVLGFQRTAEGVRFRILPMFFSKSSESSEDEEGLSFTLGKGGTEGETEYRIGLIPFGGYVKLLGQDDVGPVKQISDPRSFANKSVGVRAAVISAGVIFNVISAAIVLMIVFLVGINFPPPVVGGVVPDSPAARAGLQPGDEFIEIDGDRRNLDFSSISLAAALSGPNEPVPVTIRRPDGTTAEMKIVAEHLPGGQVREFGIEQPISLTLASVDKPEVLKERTGLLPGDTVTAVNGEPVEHEWTFDKMVRETLSPTVTLTGQHTAEDGWTEQVQTQLGLGWLAGQGEVKSEADLAQVYSMVPRLRVLTDQVASSDGADGDEDQRLLAGDIIVAVDGVENPTYLELRETTVKFEDKPLAVKVIRADPNGQEQITTVTVTPKRNPATDRVVIGFIPLLDAERAVVAQTVQSQGGVPKLDIPRGARITAVNGQAISSFYDLIREVRRGEGQPVALEYRLDGEVSGGVTLQTAQAARPIQVESTLLEPLPFKGLEQLYRAGSPLQAIRMGYRKTVMFITMTYITLGQLIGGLLSPKLLMGPVGIVVSSYQIVAREPLVYYAYFLGLISASIAVLNFLPIPPFDGGLIVLMLVEKIRGAALSEKAQGIVAYAGWALVLMLLLYVTYNDIARTLSGFFS